MSRGRPFIFCWPTIERPCVWTICEMCWIRDPLFEVLSAPRYEFAETDYAYAGSKKKSLHSSLSQETPHLVFEYQQLLAEALDHNGPQDEKGENPTQ